MSVQVNHMPEPRAADMPDLGAVHLNGKWLSAGRVSWALIFVLSVVVFSIAAVKLYDVQSTPCGTNPIADTWTTCAEFQDGIRRIGLSPASFGAYLFGVRLLAALPFFALSALLVWRRAGEFPVLLIAILLSVVGAAGTWFNPLWDWARHFIPVLNQPVNLLGTVLLCGFIFGYAFPDGRFVPRWTRWLALGCVPLAIVRTFLAGTVVDIETWPTPMPQLIDLSLAATAVYAISYRYRHVASPVQRQQIKWVVAGFSLLFANWLVDYSVWNVYPALAGKDLLTSGFAWALWELLQDSSWYVSQFLLAICLGLAVLRYRLWDIDVIINRALVYGVLTAAIVGTYLVIAVGLGAVLHARGNPALSLAATLLVALLVQPARASLQQRVNRLLYGERDEPYAVLSRLGQRLEASLAPEAALQTIADTLSQGLKLPFAAIEMERESSAEMVAVAGYLHGEPFAVPLTYQHEHVGRLLLGLRRGEHHFSPADERLLHDIAHRAGAVVYAHRLSLDLQRSRERLVAAREDERRRLRRDLHDGLGPTLASLFQRLDLVTTLIERDPVAATRLVTDLQLQVRGTIADIRRLVYALRPPALDELGLVGALREQIARYDGTEALRITLEAPEEPLALPAAAEVAAYRIVSEALTNVVRHANATSCRIRIIIDDDLLVEVTDDGDGIPDSFRAGVGVTAMRERAAEVGGEWGMERLPGGTRVWARIPVGGAA